MKIVYIYSTLATTGGTEKMIIEKANYLADHFGYDVTIITCFQCKYEKNFFSTSKKVKQIYLEIPYFSQYKYSYPKRLWAKWKVNRLLRQSIYQSVKQEDPDILIGILRFKANFVSTIKCLTNANAESGINKLSLPLLEIISIKAIINPTINEMCKTFSLATSVNNNNGTNVAMNATQKNAKLPSTDFLSSVPSANCFLP